MSIALCCSANLFSKLSLECLGFLGTRMAQMQGISMSTTFQFPPHVPPSIITSSQHESPTSPCTRFWRRSSAWLASTSQMLLPHITKLPPKASITSSFPLPSHLDVKKVFLFWRGGNSMDLIYRQSFFCVAKLVWVSVLSCSKRIVSSIEAC